MEEIIALQMNAYKQGDDISLAFTKVIDRVTLGSDEEDVYEVTDRNYWENRSTKKIMKEVDAIFKDLGQYTSGYELKYNKFYIGLTKDGIANNFILFKPKKNYLYFVFKTSEDKEKFQLLDNEGLEYSYTPRWKELAVKISDFDEYKKHKELLDKLAKTSMDDYKL